MTIISPKKAAIIADLKRYALENYSEVAGMDYAVETFDFEDWVIIANKSKGDFAKAVAILKAEVKMIEDHAAEIRSTAF